MFPIKQEATNARVALATREALILLGLNPGQHGLVNAAVHAVSTGSSAFPRMMLPESPCGGDAGADQYKKFMPNEHTEGH